MSIPWSKLALDVFTPDTLPSFEGKKGWGSLFGMDNGNGEAKRVGIETYPDSYWHRIDFNQLTFFSHAQNSTGKLSSDHRHLDLCGFVLYFDGQPIFIDCGRSDYTQSALSNYGYSAASHSTIYVNELSLRLMHHGCKQLIGEHVKTELLEQDGSVTFTIKHNGFDRISNLKVIRT